MDAIPAEAHHLGSPVATYRPSGRTKLRPLVGVLLFPMALALFVGSYFAFRSGDNIAYFLALIGVVLIGLGLWILYLAIHSRDLGVWLFSDGIAYRDGGQTRVMHWDDIGWVWQQVTKHYYNGIPTGTTHKYTLQLLDGDKFTLNQGLERIGELGEHVQNEVFRRQFPKAAQAYNSGQELNFGKLRISRAGISNGKETLPWEQVKGIKLANGQIVVSRQGKWLAWAGMGAHEVPNLFILLELISQIVGIQ